MSPPGAVQRIDRREFAHSQGEYVKYLGDGQDGFNCCAWIVQQPWSNGRIGTQGLSYGAHTTTALACLDAPGLAAMFIDSGGFANAYNYVALARRKRGPQRLILGPWTHGNNHETFAGDVDFGPAALLSGNVAADLLTLRMRWFDRWLKGEKNAADSEPAVRIFVMGGGTGRKNTAARMDHGGQWRSEKQWPLPGTVRTRFYLHGDGTLSKTAPRAGSPPRVQTAPLASDVEMTGEATGSVSMCHRATSRTSTQFEHRCAGGRGWRDASCDESRVHG